MMLLLLLLAVVVLVMVLSTDEVEVEMASTLTAAGKPAADMAMDSRGIVTIDTTGVTGTITTEGVDDMGMAEKVLEVEPG